VPIAKREAGMTDQQFKTIVAHLQVMIAILGVMAGVMPALDAVMGPAASDR
jgi:hypothetical protein